MMTRSHMMQFLRFTDQDEDKPALEVSGLPNLNHHSLTLHYEMMTRHVILANLEANLIGLFGYQKIEDRLKGSRTSRDESQMLKALYLTQRAVDGQSPRPELTTA